MEELEVALSSNANADARKSKINSDMLDLIQEARNELGPLSINSGYRCSTHNAKVSSTGPNGPPTPIVFCRYWS